MRAGQHEMQARRRGGGRFFSAMGMLLVVGALGLGTLGCIVHHAPAATGSQPSSSRCRASCAEYAERNRCQQRCDVWRDGACVAYKEVCETERTCVRQTTTCDAPSR